MSQTNRFSSLSIQHRLPLLICTLLLVVIIAVSWASYIGMRKSALEVGRQRLLTLTEQLSNMFQQSGRQLKAAMQTAAANASVKDFLQPTGKSSRDSVLVQFKKLRTDTTVMIQQLLNIDGVSLLNDGKAGVESTVDIRSELQAALASPEYLNIGKFYSSGDSMYYPVIVGIMNAAKKPLGYIVQWRKISTSRQSLEQVTKLLGTGGQLYVGNNDGGFWTNLLEPVTLPAFQQSADPNIITYTRNGEKMYASAKRIPTTSWQVLVEFPRTNIVEAANHMLYWILSSGIALLLLSMLVAWMMSRNITRPLKQLTTAASAIAAGNLSTKVNVDRADELGKLARAFNAMSVQIQHAHGDLEKKVRERTAQLLAVNKELEAFSYSVSHDLRVPLRAVSGYAVMLKEDYGREMDPEANRIMDAIVNNANMMGQLIDDLIAFSKIGRKEVAHALIDMNQLAESCVQEIQENNGSKKYDLTIDPLPSCEGDRSMMKQVWLNLISNAIKYSSKENTPRIRIGYKEDAYGHIYFIKDNGVGFDMQYAHKLFGVFQRLHSPEAFEGTGVGLALAKRIINKHSGDIWAESAPGKGATFYISIPKIRTNELQ